jgi:hypothetical protein
MAAIRRVSTYYTFGHISLSSLKLDGVKYGRRCATAKVVCAPVVTMATTEVSADENPS